MHTSGKKSPIPTHSPTQLTMSASVIDAFKNLQLQKVDEISDHQTVFDISYQYLSKVKDFQDLDSYHRSLVALINLDKFHRAVQLVNEVPSEVHLEFPLEKAYVYYRTGRADLVEEVFKSTSALSEVNDLLLRALKHVVAQSRYQRGDFTGALEIYQQLAQDNEYDRELDLACNEKAVFSQLYVRWDGKEPRAPSGLVSDTYDAVYNDGLIALAKGELANSRELLEKAAALCRKQLGDIDTEQEEIELELAPIQIALAYIHQLKGEKEQAVNLLQSIKVEDPLTQFLVKNNLHSLEPDSDNVNFIARDVQYEHHLHILRNRLTKFQLMTVIKNHLLISYQSNTLSKKSSYLLGLGAKRYAEHWEGDLTVAMYKLLLKLDIKSSDFESHVTPTVRKLLKFVKMRLASEEIDDLAYVAVLLLMQISTVSRRYDFTSLVIHKFLNEGGDKLFILRTLFHNWINFRNHCDIVNWPMIWHDVSRILDITRDLLPDLSNAEKLNYVRGLAIGKAGLEDGAGKLGADFASTDPTDKLVHGVVTHDNSGFADINQFASEKEVSDLINIELSTLLRAAPEKVSHKPHMIVNPAKKRKPRFSKRKIYKANGEFNAKDLDAERWLPMKLRSYYKPTKKNRKKVGGLQGALEQSPAPLGGFKKSRKGTK